MQKQALQFAKRDFSHKAANKQKHCGFFNKLRGFKLGGGQSSLKSLTLSLQQVITK
jgi:hypothetical protein